MAGGPHAHAPRQGAARGCAPHDRPPAHAPQPRLRPVPPARPRPHAMGQHRVGVGVRKACYGASAHIPCAALPCRPACRSRVQPGCAQAHGQRRLACLLACHPSPAAPGGRQCERTAQRYSSCAVGSRRKSPAHSVSIGRCTVGWWRPTIGRGGGFCSDIRARHVRLCVLLCGNLVGLVTSAPAGVFESLAD